MAWNRNSRLSETFVRLHVSKVSEDEQNPSISFDGRSFTQYDAPDIAPFLRNSAEHSKDLLIVLIEGYSTWLHGALSAAIPSIPMPMLDYVGSYQRATYGQAILPTFHENSINFALEHVDVPLEAGTMNSKHGFEARWTPLSTWFCQRSGLLTQPDIPIIVIAGKSKISLAERLTELYSQDHLRRYNRLKAFPHWIYTDLLFEFTKWDEVWGETREYMNVLRDEIYGVRAALPILAQTRALHRYMETIINQRECLRNHIASVKAYATGTSYLSTLPNQTIEAFPPENYRDFERRLSEVEIYLEHHQLTSETTIRSMENLLSLAFNTETVSQGLQIKRLNYLALVFLPLGYVASIFGMTTITLLPKWYPACAFPALIGTIFLALFFGKANTWWENFRMRRARGIDGSPAKASYSIRHQPTRRARPSTKQYLSSYIRPPNSLRLPMGSKSTYSTLPGYASRDYAI